MEVQFKEFILNLERTEKGDFVYINIDVLSPSERKLLWKTAIPISKKKLEEVL
jgi:hypothetical protein